MENNVIATDEDIDALFNNIINNRENEGTKYKELLTSRAFLSPEERQIAYAKQLEGHYRETGNTEGLAEALHLQGRFHEAMDISNIKERKEMYAEMAKSLDTATPCDCERVRNINGKYLPMVYIESVRPGKDGNMVNFIRCTVCNNLWAGDLPKILDSITEIQENPLYDNSFRRNYFNKKR